VHGSYSRALDRRHRDFEDKNHLCKLLGITQVFAIREATDPRSCAAFDVSEPSRLRMTRPAASWIGCRRASRAQRFSVDPAYQEPPQNDTTRRLVDWLQARFASAAIQR